MESLNRMWSKRKEISRAAVLLLVGLTAIYTAVPRPSYHDGGIASSHATGLAAQAEWAPPSLWIPSLFSVRIQPEMMTYSAALSSDPSDQAGTTYYSRKVAHTSAFYLTVSRPAEAMEKIRALSVQLGGYLEASQIGGDASSASISIRVPVTRAEEAKAEIRKLAIRVESETIEAEDITKQWVDTDARLRNLRATEQQYLQILKRAASVSDTVEVTGKLSEIRGQIEQQQAEFAALAKRVDTVAISVQLHADAEVQVFGLHWQPLYRAKLSLRDAVDALGNYSASMFAVILHFPVIALWLITLVAFAAIGWKLLRWAARVFFGWKLQAKT